MGKVSENTLFMLKQVSTATVATALYKRGLRNQFIQGVQLVKKGKPTMLGEAFTLRYYIPDREDLNAIEVFQNLNHPQRLAAETCTEGAVLVMDSRKNARTASAGSILVTRLMMLKAAAILTDGDCTSLSQIAVLV